MLAIRNLTRNTVLADRAKAAHGSDESNTGLLKHTSLPKGEGLLIPTQAVHCFFMKFAIDLVWVDKNKKVLKVTPSVKPWRIAVCLQAHSVLELPSGMAAETQTVAGDQLEFQVV